MAATKLNITSLDRQAIKSSFISYLQTTSEFQNFNYNASGVSSVIDLLANNTYYQALMSNFLFNESMLSSASKRENVVSRAQELGYVPKSRKASKATLNVVVRNVFGSPTVLVMPSNTLFNADVGTQTFSFCTINPYTANKQVDAQGEFYSFVVDVYEGIFSQYSFTTTTSFTSDIPASSLDTDTLRTFVTIDVTEYEFYQPKNFLTVGANDHAYFLREGKNGYQVYFGDGKFGYKPLLNSSVRCTYLITTGQYGNGAASFAITSTLPNAATANVSVYTITQSSGGAEREDIESVRINSPMGFSAQDRAVTYQDYKSLILTNSSFVKDVLTWGGETNNPPAFGKVFVCAQPRFGDTLTTSDKTNISSFVLSKSMPNVGLVYVDPEYLNILVSTTAVFNSKLLSTSSYDLQIKIQETILSFISDNLTKFNGRLRYSQMVGAIDKCNSSMISNVTKIKLLKQFIPTLYQAGNVSFTFANIIDNLDRIVALSSTTFMVAGSSNQVWIEDDNNGVLNLMYTKNGTKSIQQYNVGTIDYQTGLLNIPSLTITSFSGTSIDFTALPYEQDLFSKDKLIIRVAASDISVNIIADK